VNALSVIIIKINILPLTKEFRAVS